MSWWHSTCLRYYVLKFHPCSSKFTFWPFCNDLGNPTVTFCGSLSNRTTGSNLTAIKAKNISVASIKGEKHYPRQNCAYFSYPVGFVRSPVWGAAGVKRPVLWLAQAKTRNAEPQTLFLFLYKAHPHTPGKKTRNFYFPQTLEACFSSMPWWNQKIIIAYQTCMQSVPAIDFFPGSVA